MVDFAGTLIRQQVIEEANVFRSRVLERGLPSIAEHAQNQILYKANREAVEKLTGIALSMKIQYRENNLHRLELTGEDVQNQISTNLFQIGMFMAAKKYGKLMVPQGFLAELENCKKKKYKLAIVSGVREDIITGMLAIAGIDIFNYIYGQPPILGVSTWDNIRDLKRRGTITHIIGDKMSDIELCPKIKATSIFVTWGAASGGEAEFADVTISKPEELGKIIV